MHVNDPTGQQWRIGRRWLPWRRRPDPAALEHAAHDDGGDTNAAYGVLGALLVMSFFFAAPILLLAIFAAGWFALLLLLLPLAVLVRIAMGRWQVEVLRGRTPWAEVEGGSWASSGRRIQELADALRRGEIPTRNLGTDPPA